MSIQIRSLIDQGLEGVVVDVECHLSNNLPNIVIVGVANKAVDEAKERLRGAFASSKLQLPRKRITLNLAPADVPKDGSSFDLAMATAILVASGQINRPELKDYLLFGELGLDGDIRPIRGIIGKLLSAKKRGLTQFIIPEANLPQAQLVSGISLLAFGSLAELVRACADTLKPIPVSELTLTLSKISYEGDFADVIGQAQAKRALEIAAAGHHNILLSGAPGTGKSMLAKALPSILPPLSREEVLAITHLHSLSSNQYDQIVALRPFRSPHHSASDVAIIGGGSRPRPGEVSLAHYGVLFLDELPEFGRTTIETLRQPLEDKIITIARAKDSLSFPADFILVATRNPCPCGYYGTNQPCICTPQQVQSYEKKLSGPILDRIDLYIEVEPVEHRHLLHKASGEESSEKIRKRISRTRDIQLQRTANMARLNGSLSARATKEVANLSPGAKELLDTASDRLKLSARGYMRAVKVARTIADLDESNAILETHIAEALQYRPKRQNIL